MLDAATAAVTTTAIVGMLISLLSFFSVPLTFVVLCFRSTIQQLII